MRVVVGAAIVRAGRVLAARRSAPAALAGGWEFPGGKVEPGESPAAALARECREELGVQIAVGELLGAADIAAGFVLHVHVAELIAGEPQPLQDHDELRWLAGDELEDVPWLPADRPVLGALRERL
ncbi:MAG TPA: (deoxy)nucleoside triphosphate pyrophosphohydrolase [Jatrophihabitantaceae bacterium]|nr:(deoxy)nucleoside triphosphate pyrophosphohydrolase [Jatrophihabitantaceae bacterium]